MGRKHSEETRAKISASQRARHARKRDGDNPTVARARELHGAFVSQVPEGTSGKNVRVRNHGDFGRDIKPITPRPLTSEHEDPDIQSMADAAGVKRGRQLLEERQGKSYQPRPVEPGQE